MLVFARKPNQTFVIDGRITVRVLRVNGPVVKIGLEAPPAVPIHREEVYHEIQRTNRAAAVRGAARSPNLKPRREPPDRGSCPRPAAPKLGAQAA
jgi:carbon storage regulator